MKKGRSRRRARTAPNGHHKNARMGMSGDPRRVKRAREERVDRDQERGIWPDNEEEADPWSY